LTVAKKAVDVLPLTINKDGSRKKISAACWHVHGNFFDLALKIAPKAIINSAGKTIHIDDKGKMINNWEDWDIGSMVFPCMYSQACDC
jgi:hypothetical protein